MKTTIKALLLASCASLFSGCYHVILEQPFGEADTALQQRDLQGVWVDPEQRTTEVRLNKAGRLIYGGAVWRDDQQKFVAENWELLPTHIDGTRFLNVGPLREGSDRPTEYVLVRFEQPSTDTLHWYLPRVDLFADAVRSGKLTGKLEEPLNSNSDKRSVRLTSLTGLKEFLQERGVQACFEDEPFVLRRVKGTQ